MKFVFISVLVLSSIVFADPENMPISVVGSGAVRGENNLGHGLRGTVGQAIARRMVSANEVLRAGFWPSRRAAVPLRVGETQIALPTKLEFHAAYPNPFNPSTTLSFSLPQTSDVKVQLFDVTGRSVATLVNGKYVAGTHRMSWNATALASGTYFARLNAVGFSHTQKLQLIK